MDREAAKAREDYCNHSVYRRYILNSVNGKTRALKDDEITKGIYSAEQVKNQKRLKTQNITSQMCRRCLNRISEIMEEE